MERGQSQSLAQPAFKAETADDLRELITQAELIVANLRGAGPRAQTLLFLLDAIHGLAASLSDTGVDLRAEATRIETVERILQSKDGILVREMGRLGGLARAREAVKPSLAQWWWHLDLRVAERQRQQLRQALKIGGGVVAVLLVISLLYRYVFPPDPRRVAVMDLTSQADRALEQGEPAAALARYQEAVEVMPEDPELWVWVGVLAETLGDDELAARAYATAEELVVGPARLLIARGMAWLRVGNLERAEIDAEAALEIEPDAAEGYLILASVYETRGDALQAIAALEKTAELATEANNSALIVLAKTRLGMLLQSAPMMQPTLVTPTPAADS
jgi:tetratricopeptide (TPR) repeat protein